MTRLHIIVEGQTEQKFVKDLLAPHLGQFGVFADARCVYTSHDRRNHKTYRGGLRDYEKAKRDLTTWMKEDSSPHCYFTTLFDYYALPNNFPKYHEAHQTHTTTESIRILEQSFADDIADPRFIAYLQMHEFEALLLSDPQKLDWEYLEHEAAIQTLVSLVAQYPTPEMINQGADTAPSKRILRVIPEYDKVNAGIHVLQRIGLPTIRQRCPHFDEWLCRLEQLGLP